MTGHQYSEDPAEAHVPITRLVGSSLLAVIAAAALVVSALMLFAAWATGSQLTGWVADAGTAAVLIIAGLAVAYGALAAYATWQTWRARPLGRMLGLAVAIIAVLAAGTTLGGQRHESARLLYLAIGLGVATAIPMVLPDRAASVSSARARGSTRAFGGQAA